MQAREVRVWVARPAAFGPTECDAMRRLLDDDERARAERLRAAEDRRAYVIAHGLARNVLAGLLGRDPAALRFVRDAHGKPALQHGDGPELFFSLTHTRGLVACAASFEGPLGLDVEALDGAAAEAELLDLFLQPPQPGLLAAAPTAAFFASWTALEAYWKARGTGLSTANPRLQLMRAGGCLQAELEGDASGASRLVITPVDAAPGFALALACRWVPTLRVAHWGHCAPKRTQKCDKQSFDLRGDASIAALC